MIKYILISILIIFFVYLVIWTLKLYFFEQRQKKVKRVQELRAKGKHIKKTLPDATKNYWYNLREIEECGEEANLERYYHYFNEVEDGAHSLLLEMYDCGLVRTDELEKIAYGKNSFANVDLSFLKELEQDMGINSSVIQLEEGLSDFFKPKKKEEHDNKEKDDVVNAAKNLKKDDPGIMDIHGTLSEGVEDIIAAVEDEKKKEAEKEEPILPKKEKSVEKARKAREMTANAETRKKIYEKWVGYVSELYEVIRIHADEETINKIKKSLTDYGYNDVDVLLDSPEYNL